MIKIPIKYEGFDGEELTKDLYFHLSMRQLTQMEAGTEGGMHARFEKMLSSGNAMEILTSFEDIVRRSYGEREDNDPSSFLQTPELSEKFVNSLVYDAFFTHLMGDGTAMAEFITGLLPQEFLKMPEVQKAIEEAKRTGTTDVNLPEDTGPKLLTDEELIVATGLNHPKDSKGDVLPWACREPTTAEQTRMNRQQLLECMQRKSQGWTPRDQ